MKNQETETGLQMPLGYIPKSLDLRIQGPQKPNQTKPEGDPDFKIKFMQNWDFYSFQQTKYMLFKK